MVIRGSRERIKHAEVLIKKIIDEQPVLTKVTVEIPRKVIGRIIGKGGKTIRQMCRISGTYFRGLPKSVFI
jgi:transcription antitermination factor NusA-like protein